MNSASKWTSRYPWLLVAMLWLASFLNAADRSILVATMPDIRAEFGLDATQLALINSVFFWVYAAAAFVSGQVGDTIRRSRLIAYGLIFWSVATGAMSLATGFGSLLALRAAVAIGESTYYPSATALIGDWHLPRFRSRALSLHQTGLFAGAGLGAFAAGLIADHLGWRAPFLVFAGLGLVWAAFLTKFLKDAAAEEKDPNPLTTTRPLQLVLKNRAALLICAVFFLANGASTGIMVWAPTYAHDLLGLNLAGSALLGSATINIAGFLSVPLGGYLADKLARRFLLGRFYTLAIGLFLAALFLLPILWAGSVFTIGAILVASSIGKGLFDGCIYAAMHDIVPPRARATAVGVMTTMGFIGGGLSPILVAQLSEHLSMASGLAALAIAYLLAVAAIFGARQTISKAVHQA